MVGLIGFVANGGRFAAKDQWAASATDEETAQHERPRSPPQKIQRQTRTPDFLPRQRRTDKRG